MSFMKRCNLGIVLLAFILAAVVMSGDTVVADSCVAQLSSFVTTAYNYNANIGVIVPVSATCALFDAQLYAVSEAYASNGTHLGSANTVLLSPYGGSTYSGQLVFNLLPAIKGQTLEILVSIYSGQPSSNGLLVTTTVETVSVNPNNNYASGCYDNNSCNPIYNYCRSPSNNSTTQCVGYLYKEFNGCVELIVPIYNSHGFLSSQYYTLQNLPSTYPTIGTWVTVTGQLNQGHNSTTNGAACPGNYINVTFIS